MTNPQPGISTKEWTAAKLPFEAWLRYAQMSDERQKQIEKAFRRHFRRTA